MPQILGLGGSQTLQRDILALHKMKRNIDPRLVELLAFGIMRPEGLLNKTEKEDRDE